MASQVAYPQFTKPEAPWPIVVNRQSLLVACWGSKKGADLLWHFLNKARWEIKNQNLSTSVKVIVFQEERTEIFEAIKKAKAGNSISQGTYNTLLRDFVEVGYVVNQPYSDLFEIHLDIIENAFSNPPQRAVKNGSRPKRTHEFDVNLTHYNNDTISREDYNSLLEVCVNVSKMCQCLSVQVAELTQLCQSLTQNPSSKESPEVASSATTETQSNALETMLNANDSPPDPPKEEKKIIIPDLRQGLREQAQESKQETAAQIKNRLERRKDEIFALYARLTGVARVVKSRENQDGADMLIEVDAIDEHITIAIEEIQADTFWSKQMNLRTVATQLQNRVSERNKQKNGNVVPFQKPNNRQVLSYNDPNYNINDDFYNGHAQWEDLPKGENTYATAL